MLVEHQVHSPSEDLIPSDFGENIMSGVFSICWSQKPQPAAPTTHHSTKTPSSELPVTYDVSKMCMKACMHACTHPKCVWLADTRGTFEVKFSVCKNHQFSFTLLSHYTGRDSQCCCAGA